MNLILFERREISTPLPRTDPRAVHLLRVLRRRPGETFDAGIVNGPRGKGALVAVGDEDLTLSFAWGEAPPPLEPLNLVLGLPRPQTARKILQEAAALGVARMDFFAAEKGEGGYAQSTLWSSDEWRRHLLAGAAQAFDTRLPEISFGEPLGTVLDRLPADGLRLALDNYEAGGALDPAGLAAHRVALGGVPPPVTLAFGPERGWSGPERDALRQRSFTLVHLGSRVLRTETAVVAAVVLVKSGLGRLG